MASNTRVWYDLAKELKAEDPVKYHDVIVNIISFEYDDFQNTLFAAPKMQMVQDFTNLDRPDIVQRIKDGEFDQ